MATPPDLAALFGHVDTALQLVATATGELGSAGTAAFADTSRTNPLQLVATIKRFFGQRHAKKALQEAAPHLRAIAQLHAESVQWLQAMPHADPATIALLIGLWTDGFVGLLADDIIHDRIETQLLELNNVLDELGLLHAKLRAQGFGAQATRSA